MPAVAGIRKEFTGSQSASVIQAAISYG